MRYRLQRHDGTDCSATMVPITVLRMVPIQRYRHNTLPGLFKEGNRRIIEFVKTLVGSIVNRGVLCFDFYDIGTFMRYNSDTRYVEYFSLSGDINYLKQAVNDLCKYLPPKYSSVHDISNMIILITLNSYQFDGLI